LRSLRFGAQASGYFLANVATAFSHEIIRTDAFEVPDRMQLYIVQIELEIVAVIHSRHPVFFNKERATWLSNVMFAMAETLRLELRFLMCLDVFIYHELAFAATGLFALRLACALMRVALPTFNLFSSMSHGLARFAIRALPLTQ